MSRPRVIRVLIADDNRNVRRGLRLQLEHAHDIAVIGEAANGTDAVTIARAERADVVLMDLQMPGMNGIDATRELTAVHGRRRRISVIVLTSHTSDTHVLSALDAGASSYLVKSHDSDNLVDAIRGAANGGAMLSAQVTPSLLREFSRLRTATPDVAAIARLTSAERRAVALLSGGITGNDELALRLGISINTVRSQLSAVLRKLELDDRTQLALWGIQNGLADASA